jgi:hypothetical protein
MDKNNPSKDSENLAKKAPELDVLNAWLEFSKQASRKQQWEYFVIDQFLQGNHSIRGNPQDNTVIVTKKSEAVNYPINKIFSTFRAVRAFVTRNKPMIMVDPEDMTPQAQDYAKHANSVLERDNKLNNFRKINKEWVYFGVKYGVGYRQIGYDKERKCCIRWSVDPNDLLIVQQHGEMEDAPAIIKCVTKTVGYWKEKYPDTTKDLAPDNELAATEYKTLSLEIKYQNAGISPSVRVSEQTKIGYECWYRLREKNKLGGTINKCTFVKENILETQETPFDDYPFIPYKADITPNEAAGEGHLKHIIAPQRMLNLLNTQMLEYNHLVNRGRYLLDKNSGFKVINTKEGQIIYRNPGKRVESLNPPSINSMLQWQIDFANTSIEDIGGQHQASMGATPQRVSSGDAIESLQQGDSNNISDLRDNFEDALELEAIWILKMYSLFEKEGVVINAKMDDKNYQKVAVMGQAAYDKTNSEVPERYYSEDNGDYVSVAAILPENNIKVSVTSQLGETKQAKLDLLFQLIDRGLPIKYVLEYLEFPNVGDIMSRIAEEAMGDILKQNLTNPAISAPQPGSDQASMPGGAPPMMGGASPQGPGSPGQVPPPGIPPGAPDIHAELQGLMGQIGGAPGG